MASRRHAGQGASRPGRPLTLEEFIRRHGWDNRDELLQGLAVLREPPALHHGLLAAALAARLVHFLRAHEQPGFVLLSVGFLIEEAPDTLLRPDVAYLKVGQESSDGGWRMRRGCLRGAPDLAVEIAPSEDALPALRGRSRSYLDAGGRIVWLLDPVRRVVEVHRPDAEPCVLGRDDLLAGGEVLPGWRISVGELFE